MTPRVPGSFARMTRGSRVGDRPTIHANTPQAKGRVERANKTLQDRRVKEMRRRGISNQDDANAFLPEFIEDYNKRFSVEPQNSQDAHRKVLHEPQEMALIFCLHHPRRLSKNLTFPFQNREDQIQAQGNGYRMRKSKVTVCEAFDGNVTLLYNGQVLK